MQKVKKRFVVFCLLFGVWCLKPPSPTLPPKGEGSLSIAGVENFQPLQFVFFVPLRLSDVSKKSRSRAFVSPYQEILASLLPCELCAKQKPSSLRDFVSKKSRLSELLSSYQKILASLLLCELCAKQKKTPRMI